MLQYTANTSVKIATYLDSSAIFLTKRELLGGLIYLAISATSRWVVITVNIFVIMCSVLTADDGGYVVNVEHAITAVRMLTHA